MLYWRWRLHGVVPEGVGDSERRRKAEIHGLSIEFPIRRLELA